jgi:predicted RNA-binding Zn-ribbon protein involved in translation (DUF1610 family)
MICPSKICGQEIPDDSVYCDQCGVKILRCTKCGNPGTGKFCGKCGGAMLFKVMDAPGTPSPAVRPDSPAEPPPAPAAPQTQAASSATVLVPPPAAKKLLFCHPDGWNMELADGDILGRTKGNHTDRLGSIPVISGTHAKITFEKNGWYITDQKSTNKTYIRGTMAQPGVPVNLKNNDIVQLANVKFIVREQ